jgi:hypothetical protein
MLLTALIAMYATMITDAGIVRQTTKPNELYPNVVDDDGMKKAAYLEEA